MSGNVSHFVKLVPANEAPMTFYGGACCVGLRRAASQFWSGTRGFFRMLCSSRVSAVTPDVTLKKTYYATSGLSNIIAYSSIIYPLEMDRHLLRGLLRTVFHQTDFEHWPLWVAGITLLLSLVGVWRQWKQNCQAQEWIELGRLVPAELHPPAYYDRYPHPAPGIAKTARLAWRLLMANLALSISNSIVSACDLGSWESPLALYSLTLLMSVLLIRIRYVNEQHVHEVRGISKEAYYRYLNWVLGRVFELADHMAQAQAQLKETTPLLERSRSSNLEILRQATIDAAQQAYLTYRDMCLPGSRCLAFGSFLLAFIGVAGFVAVAIAPTQSIDYDEEGLHNPSIDMTDVPRLLISFFSIVFGTAAGGAVLFHKIRRAQHNDRVTRVLIQSSAVLKQAAEQIRREACFIFYSIRRNSEYLRKVAERSLIAPDLLPPFVPAHLKSIRVISNSTGVPSNASSDFGWYDDFGETDATGGEVIRSSRSPLPLTLPSPRVQMPAPGGVHANLSSPFLVGVFRPSSAPPIRPVPGYRPPAPQ